MIVLKISGIQNILNVWILNFQLCSMINIWKLWLAFADLNGKVYLILIRLPKKLRIISAILFIRVHRHRKIYTQISKDYIHR